MNAKKSDQAISTRPDLVPAAPPENLVVAKSEELCVFAFPIPAAPISQTLSEAERQVVELMLEGLSNDEIARRRARSPRTIANQLASAFRKTGVGSRAELAARVIGRR